MLSGAASFLLLKKEFPELNVENLEQRVVLQKTVFLLQAYGINLGYRFNWYLRGPYSPLLASNAYAAVENETVFEAEIGSVKFKPSVLGKIEKFRIGMGDRLNDAEKMELAASLQFLKNIYPSLSNLEIVAKLVDEKPKYKGKETQISDELGFLETFFV